MEYSLLHLPGTSVERPPVRGIDQSPFRFREVGGSKMAVMAVWEKGG